MTQRPKPNPKLQALDLTITRIRNKLAARNPILARWFTDTLATMEARFLERADNPLELAEARAAALALVRESLRQWASRPVHEGRAAHEGRSGHDGRPKKPS